ncbi:hypothetical protein SY89_02774 [Halolamina pelagica]|jgi:Sec-independent protein secretion pathway component TatC|uniref:Uncharacterized protein n=1 Tax=Halolamina pelagica TaxID=699431 RepID=A0A0P7I4W8_9EURY|nr:hypothetical protein [Halolamina pelagica]KPN32017.1 hypothetical protein SY89_02774 [Halolamina pelagica]
MFDTRRGRFVGIALGIVAVAFPLAVLFTPPDPYTQIVVAGGVVAFALTAANVLSHPTVYNQFREE